MFKNRDLIFTFYIVQDNIVVNHEQYEENALRYAKNLVRQTGRPVTVSPDYVVVNYKDRPRFKVQQELVIYPDGSMKMNEIPAGGHEP